MYYIILRMILFKKVSNYCFFYSWELLNILLIFCYSHVHSYLSYADELVVWWNSSRSEVLVFTENHTHKIIHIMLFFHYILEILKWSNQYRVPCRSYRIVHILSYLIVPYRIVWYGIISYHVTLGCKITYKITTK